MSVSDTWSLMELIWSDRRDSKKQGHHAMKVHLLGGVPELDF
jgi:hypothetical protein